MIEVELRTPPNTQQIGNDHQPQRYLFFPGVKQIESLDRNYIRDAQICLLNSSYLFNLFIYMPQTKIETFPIFT